MRLVLTLALTGAGAAPLLAQEGSGQSSPASSGTTDGGTPHILGVLPNYSTVAPGQLAAPITTKLSFKLAAVESFDPSVAPLVGLMAAVAQLEGRAPSWGSGFGAYGKRSATSFADYAVGNLMTTAVMPTLFRQDPRYFALGKGNVLHRAGYALSRTLITRTRSGQRHINQSEILGNIAAAEISNVYHPAEDRTLSATMSRWETQILWDSLTNELKEFWPDIRRRLHKA